MEWNICIAMAGENDLSCTTILARIVSRSFRSHTSRIDVPSTHVFVLTRLITLCKWIYSFGAAYIRRISSPPRVPGTLGTITIVNRSIADGGFDLMRNYNNFRSGTQWAPCRAGRGGPKGAGREGREGEEGEEGGFDVCDFRSPVLSCTSGTFFCQYIIITTSTIPRMIPPSAVTLEKTWLCKRIASNKLSLDTLERLRLLTYGYETLKITLKLLSCIKDYYDLCSEIVNSGYVCTESEYTQYITP